MWALQVQHRAMLLLARRERRARWSDRCVPAPAVLLRHALVHAWPRYSPRQEVRVLYRVARHLYAPHRAGFSPLPRHELALPTSQSSTRAGRRGLVPPDHDELLWAGQYDMHALTGCYRLLLQTAKPAPRQAVELVYVPVQSVHHCDAQYSAFHG